MNYKKINELVLKQCYAKNPIRLVLGEVKGDSEHMAIIEDTRLIIMPKEEFKLDVEKVFDGNCIADALKLVDQNELVDVKRSAYTFDNMDSFANICRMFTTEDNVTAYVQEKYLKEFDKDATYKAGYSRSRNGDTWVSRILVYEDDELVGMVLPVRIKEDE